MRELLTKSTWVASLVALAACSDSTTPTGGDSASGGDGLGAAGDSVSGDARTVGDPVPSGDALSGGDTLDSPPGVDTTTPFPIDRGDEGGATPGSYRLLPLRLVDNGAPTVTAVRGVVGVVCIGMSNSNQECNDWISKLGGDLDGEFNAQVKVVNCAVGGHAIERWNDSSYDATLWGACIDTKLGAAGVALDQVRVIYHKAADQMTAGLPVYPDADSDYFNFIENLTVFAARVTAHFPDLQAVYSTSRMYGGFATNAGRGEPLSYEEGHALNTWLRDNASVNGVWFGWGPYIWAPDCASGTTNGSGVCYVLGDFQSDGVHPASGALEKISAMIHARFGQESWYAP